MRLDEARHTLARALACDAEKMSVADFIAGLSAKPVYLYGAGAFGRQTFRLLAAHGVAAAGFLDQKAQPGQTLYDTPVYAPASGQPAAQDRERAVLVVSIVLTYEARTALFAQLKGLGFSAILDGQSLRAREVSYAPDSPAVNLPPSAEISAKIQDAAALFADGHSRDVYARHLRAHILRDYGDCADSAGCRQYFPDVPFSKGHARFVDCGAYTGDTLAQLAQAVAIESYVGFEPDADNFRRLADTAAGLRGRLGQAFLYPCAVGGGNRVASIAAAEGSSALSDTGETQAVVTRLDDALVGFAPTFIKMDVEGAEMEALAGAKGLIQRHRPDLAVCVYHHIRDYFEIPLLLRGWDLGYRFYLRAHSSCTMETVLYATAAGEA